MAHTKFDVIFRLRICTSQKLLYELDTKCNISTNDINEHLAKVDRAVRAAFITFLARRSSLSSFRRSLNLNIAQR